MTAESEAGNEHDRFYARAMRRIYIHILWLGVAGTLVAAWQGGLTFGLGFLAGAMVSAINFNWLHRTVDSIGPSPDKQPGTWVKMLLPLRYLALGLVGYVIVRYFRVNILAALLGLFVAVAAALVEILYELIYARA